MSHRQEDQDPILYINLQECVLIEDPDPLFIDDNNADSNGPPQPFKQFIWPIRFEDRDIVLVLDNQEKQRMWREAFKECVESVFRNHSSALMLGTVDELVALLLNPSQIDPEYSSAFLHTFQSFMKPRDLLDYITNRLFVEYDRDSAGIPETVWRKTVLKPTQQRCANVLQQWMTVMAIDFIEEPGLLEEVSHLADRMAQANLGWASSQLIDDIKTIEERRAGKPKVLTKSKTTKMLGMDVPQAKIPKNIRMILTFVDCDPEEVARQLCLLDFKAYERIKPIEMIERAWGRSKYRAPMETQDQKLAHVTTFINQFNHVSHYIATIICSAERLKERSIIFARVVQLCGFLFHMQNYNMLKACLAGLNMSPVFRLKHTKANVSKKVNALLAELESNMSAEKAHKKYRELVGESDPPCIPFLGVCLTDLTFVGDGNPNMVDGKHNFTKRKVAYTIIAEFTRFQNQPFQFQPVVQIQNMILNSANKTEEELYNMSLSIEPRNSKKNEITQ